MDKLPHVVCKYLEEHYLSKMPPPKSRSKSKQAKACNKMKESRSKATDKGIKKIILSVKSMLEGEEESSSKEEEASATTLVSTNTTGGCRG
mmetsp:Transcript_4586/g.6969  ORF Transcript_4586/g.6969 Transcript_4586/m.6969 type:complete len:91 (-) Transcript_4586:729-1001(-)